MPNDQKGLIQVVIFLILVVGLVVTLVLIKTPVKLFPKAYQVAPDTSLTLSPPDPAKEVAPETGLVASEDKVVIAGRVADYRDIGISGVRVYYGNPNNPKYASEEPAVSNENGYWEMQIDKEIHGDCNLDGTEKSKGTHLCPNVYVYSMNEEEFKNSGWDTVSPRVYSVPLDEVGFPKPIRYYNFLLKGNYEVRGTVFMDWNKNGLKDQDEQGIGGVPIMVDTSLDDRYYPTLFWANPEKDGTYIIDRLPPLSSFIVKAADLTCPVKVITQPYIQTTQLIRGSLDQYNFAVQPNEGIECMPNQGAHKGKLPSNYSSD